MKKKKGLKITQGKWRGNVHSRVRVQARVKRVYDNRSLDMVRDNLALDMDMGNNLVLVLLAVLLVLFSRIRNRIRGVRRVIDLVSCGL